MSLKYTSSQSKYYYPNTDILINKLDIRDQQLLTEAEVLYTSQRLIELEYSPLIDSLDLENLKGIHHYIFQDIYYFAGKIREVDISKGNTLFAHWQYIVPNANELFKKLKRENFLLGTNIDDFSTKAAYYMAELNALHPFREGNGRTIREFIRVVALNANYKLSWNALNYDKLLEASIQSITDTKPLENCIRDAIMFNI